MKGFVGRGNISSGDLTDEDWDFLAYSNTSSEQRDGSLRYATIDVGYDLLRGPGYKVGPFIGYNYFKEDVKAFGCVQNGNSFIGVCGSLAQGTGFLQIPTSVLVITQSDTFESLRIGSSAEVMLLDRLLTTDAAYIPYMTVGGLDNHVLRDLLIHESGKGQGVQVEAVLSYYVTPQFSVGIGGRYWALWTTRDAIAQFEFSGVTSQCPCQTLPTKTERYGAFFQAAYKFDTSAAAVVARY